MADSSSLQDRNPGFEVSAKAGMAHFEPLPVDANVARAYGRIYAAISGTGRKARGARSLDLLIAATALASNLPLYTRNPRDFRGTESLIDIVAVAAAN